MKGGGSSLPTITLCTGALSISRSCRDSETDTMSSDIVTSSRGDKERTWSATKVISHPLYFDGFEWLAQPKMGHKAMLGMLDIQEIVKLDTAMMNQEGRKALIEAYEKTEVFGTEFTYRLPNYRSDRRYENSEELCTGLQWMEDRGMVSREHTLRLSDHDGEVIADKNDHLHVLIQGKRRAMVRKIISNCFKSYDINAYNHKGHTPLMYTPLYSTVMYEEPELCRLLCERSDVDVEKGNKSTGATPLHEAAFCDRIECMRILLDVGKVNVNAKSKVSSTPLHYSAWKGHIEVATLLIERGANINPLDKVNETPLDYAYKSNRIAMAAFLETRGAKTGTQMVAPAQPAVALPL